MPPENTGTVICDFRNAYGEPIRGEVKFSFKNLKAQTMNFDHSTTLTGERLRLTDVPATPFGNWKIEIKIKRFRSKTLFVDVDSNAETMLDGGKEEHRIFFVRPSEASPIFPSPDEIHNEPRWKALSDVLNESTVKYANLNDQQKAGLLNLFAKMSHDSAQNVFQDVTKIFVVKPARIYAEVESNLWDRVGGLTNLYREQSDGGSLHDFVEGWDRLAVHASFKTPDRMGNLQLTFATNVDKQYAIDADLDDHQGIKHAFDVVKHTFSGDTNPYDIHDVLVKFHGIDPGYRLY